MNEIKSKKVYRTLYDKWVLPPNVVCREYPPRVRTIVSGRYKVTPKRCYFPYTIFCYNKLFRTLHVAFAKKPVWHFGSVVYHASTLMRNIYIPSRVCMPTQPNIDEAIDYFFRSHFYWFCDEVERKEQLPYRIHQTHQKMDQCLPSIFGLFIMSCGILPPMRPFYGLFQKVDTGSVI